MPWGSRYCAEQLCLEDEFALFVLLTGFIGLVILPAYCLFALPAVNVAYDVSASRHIALVRVGLGDVDDAVKEVCFAMLATEISTEDIIVVGEMRFAVLAAIDARRVEVDVVCEPHGGYLLSRRAWSVERGAMYRSVPAVAMAHWLCCCLLGQMRRKQVSKTEDCGQAWGIWKLQRTVYRRSRR
jgi:hypothetical protein